MRLLDLFSGAGGTAMGYSRAGFDEIVGVDIVPQPRYPFAFQQADALEFLAQHGHEFDAIHASPPCQGYSIMHNLPWLRGREYPLLILPTIEMLEGLGKPYVVENVMGARYGSKTLKKRGLEAHGLKAGWLCGTMFGLPFYRHRLFASNWFWLAPGHPKHVERIRAGRSLAGRARDIVFNRESAGRDGGGPTQPFHSLADGQVVVIPTKSGNFDPYWREKQDGKGGLTVRPGYEKVPFSYPTIVGERLRADGRRKDSKISLYSMSDSHPLANWQNVAQGNGVGIGHAKGWWLAAEAMGIDWMKRDELTQAIPPCYTEFIGRRLLEVL